MKGALGTLFLLLSVVMHAQFVGEGMYICTTTKLVLASTDYSSSVQKTLSPNDYIQLTDYTLAEGRTMWCYTSDGNWISDLGLRFIGHGVSSQPTTTSQPRHSNRPVSNVSDGENLRLAGPLNGFNDPRIIGLASAVVVDAESRVLATNYHVAIEGDLHAWINGEFVSLQKLRLDEKNDLALLQVSKESVRLKSAPIRVHSELGERVFAVGYPLLHLMGKDIKVTEGIISSVSFLGDATMFQISCPITRGNSGGGLFDEHGNLVGITQGGWRPDEDTENVNSAIKSIYLTALIQTEGGITTKRSNTSVPIDFTILDQYVLPIAVSK